MSHPCGACKRRFPTENEVFSHECPDAQRRWQVVPNGFGGTTTVRRSVAASTSTTITRRVQQPASKSSTNYLRSLLAERAGIPAAEKIRDNLNDRRERGQLTQVVVSEAIDRLKEIPRPRRENGTQQRFRSPA